MIPIIDPWFYFAAIPAVIVVGLSKGGFGGTMGMLAVPILTLAISPVQAAGIILPILVLMDIVALIAYKGRANWQCLSILLPATVVGIGIGWAAAAYVNDDFVRLLVGLISLAFVADHVFKGRKQETAARHNPAKGFFWGGIAGFTSFISHTGGPPYQMYTVPLRMPQAIYAGTAVIFFATGNAIKLVPYFLLGQFDTTNLTTSAVLVPLAFLATLAGIRLVRLVKAETFYTFIYVFMAVIGLKLTYDGLVNLLA
ncbi:sulfite exporter TauE/SafE family protein [Roseibium album]|uniref:sulfite exporter TauE/SafE family protein n=1 Tax=Roseibium album TaxID=311410 RepID=UPI003919B68A